MSVDEMYPQLNELVSCLKSLHNVKINAKHLSKPGRIGIKTNERTNNY